MIHFAGRGFVLAVCAVGATSSTHLAALPPEADIVSNAAHIGLLLTVVDNFPVMTKQQTAKPVFG